MKIISHRGNIRGPIPDKENRPSYIDCAIGNGYDVEIDVRSINGELWVMMNHNIKLIIIGWISVEIIFGCIVKILKQQLNVGHIILSAILMTPLLIRQLERSGCTIFQ